MQRKTFSASLLIVLLTGCDECREYSDFSCSQIQKADYNVYFYFPNGREYYLGPAEGLNQCGDVAYSYAASKNLNNNSDWSYICCMKAKGSECYEKHR